MTSNVNDIDASDCGHIAYFFSPDSTCTKTTSKHHLAITDRKLRILLKDELNYTASNTIHICKKGLGTNSSTSLQL